MSGTTTDGGAGHGVGQDLLRRATQAMMSRSAAAAPEEDAADQIGFDTPRSGVATPQPDLHDKRLPGIASYFNQVRAASFTRPLSGTVTSTAQAAPAHAPGPAKPHCEETRHSASLPQPRGDPPAGAPPRFEAPNDSPTAPYYGDMGRPSEKTAAGDGKVHPYPTPPPSGAASLRNVKMSDSSSDAESGGVLLPGPRSSFFMNYESRLSVSQWRRGSGLAVTSVTESTAQAKFSRAVTSPPAAAPVPPAHVSHVTAQTKKGPSLHASSFTLLKKKLTSLSLLKSGQNTPTRSLSTAQPLRVDTNADQSKPAEENGAPPAAAAVVAQPSAVTPAPRGKLTVKILEARGLRRSRQPYVIALFQRSELISGGPRDTEDENNGASAGAALGAIPMKRQASDTGRAMAIPMRSRQSSNTSVTDYNTFRNRTARKSFTNPKWDAEGTYDVVTSDLLVDISVYDHATTGAEEFLGHVDFQAKLSEQDGPVQGWFALKGNADTMAENAPTGEIYVEAHYQRTDRKHFGPEDFQILRLIGKGTFGQVYQVRKKDTGRVFAMKVLSKKVIVQKKEVAHTVGERNILVRTAMADSPFIVGLKFSFQTPADLYLVTDYMSGGELFWHLQKEGRFDETRAKFYIAELILAIQHLHENDIVYRDLKPENILLDANGHIALCDFGLSKANLTKNDTTNTFCGTTEYLAPEVLLDETGYGKMVDFWSLGVLVFEMCCGWSPFYAEDTQQMYKNIAFGKVRFPKDTLSADGRGLVKGLLNRNPKHRLGAKKDAEELKVHPFFKDIDWDALTKKLITPPFRPRLTSDTDVSYFDPEFTNALNTNGSLNERAAALARGITTSTPLSPSVQANFQGFTYVDESALDDHMRDRVKYEDDEEMDDAERGKEDQDWDDFADIDPRKSNRMSGIEVGAGHDDHMFQDPHFDM